MASNIAAVAAALALRLALLPFGLLSPSVLAGLDVVVVVVAAAVGFFLFLSPTAVASAAIKVVVVVVVVVTKDVLVVV